MPAPRGMASQHLWTFERIPVNKELLTGTVPVNKKILTGTVPINNLFLYGKSKVFSLMMQVLLFFINPLSVGTKAFQVWLSLSKTCFIMQELINEQLFKIF